MTQYPSYKDSGIEWLGVIPAHWEVKRLKYAAPLYVSKLDAKPEDETYIGLENVESWTGRLVIQDQPESVQSAVGQFEAGDVLFGKLRPYLAKAARPDFSGVSTCELLVLRPLECSQSYLLYSLLNESYIHWVDTLTYGTKMPRVSPDQVGNRDTSLPPLPEQHAIADFLDRKTGKIDVLVAKKERLIELLQEKRTALITHAVTKGLDPDVPLKDSGIEWLGEIPAHWALRRIKHLLVGRKGAIKTGPFGSHLHSSEMMDSEIKVFNQRTVIDRDIRGGLNYISMAKFDELKAFEAFPGDLLITTRGTIGRCMIIPTEAPPGILHPCLLRIQIDTTLAYDHYIEFLIEESGLTLAQLQLMSNSTTIEVIYSESFKETLLPIPPLPEQRAIADFLDLETAKIDALVAKVREAIDRLKELRTALISAAVTGKIDVRKEAA